MRIIGENLIGNILFMYDCDSVEVSYRDELCFIKARHLSYTNTRLFTIPIINIYYQDLTDECLKITLNNKKDSK